jgi:hypothetical protein
MVWCLNTDSFSNALSDVFGCMLGDWGFIHRRGKHLYFDMDMSYTRVLHPKVLHQRTASQGCALYKSQMTSRILRYMAAAMRAHNVLCNSYNSITVEMNHCSFRRVRFALLYIVTHSKIV